MITINGYRNNIIPEYARKTKFNRLNFLCYNHYINELIIQVFKVCIYTNMDINLNYQ